MQPSATAPAAAKLVKFVIEVPLHPTRKAPVSSTAKTNMRLFGCIR
jgi:hypothetical protein